MIFFFGVGADYEGATREAKRSAAPHKPTLPTHTMRTHAALQRLLTCSGARDRRMRPRSAREGGILYLDAQASAHELGAIAATFVGDERVHK